MKIKKLLLLITSAANLAVILTTNGGANCNENTIFHHNTNVGKVNFRKMAGINGQINSLTFHNQQIYAVNDEGVLYKSEDGQSFTATALTNYKIKSLITMPNNSIYAATYEKTSNATKIYMLNNEQLTIKYTLNNQQLLTMTFDKENNIYIGTEQGVYTNSPWSDQLTQIEGTSGHITTLKTTNDGLIYAGNNEGKIFKSIGGYPFDLVDQLTTGGITSIAVNNNGTVFVTNKSSQVYYKTVTSANFSSYKQHLATNNTTAIFFGGGLLVGDANGNIWKSYQAKDFTLLNENNLNAIKELIYDVDNFTIFVTTSDGIYKNK